MKRLATLLLLVAAGIGLPLVTAPIALADSHGKTAGAGVAAGSELVIPVMNAANGRKLFVSKGCVACHSINGVGGSDGALDAAKMPRQMNPFDFAAKMWRGASVMVLMQRKALGKQTQLTGQELADIIAFVHSAGEQRNFSKNEIPPEIMKLVE